MHKLTLLAALGALTLSACDFGSSGVDFTTDAGIASVEVTDLRPIHRGENWDADGNPDVFIEVRNASGRAFYRSEVIPDADVSQALRFDVSDVFVASPTMPMFVAVFDMDEDLVHSQEMATSGAFTAEDLRAGELTLGDEGRSSNAQIAVRPAAVDIEIEGDV